MDNNRPAVSVVVPMHNESANLPDTILKIAAELERHNYTFEIVAVDDGSTDDTEAKLRDLGRSAPYLRIISYRPNQGRGYAIREGIREAQGDIICTTDADLSYTPDHLPRMIELFARFPRLDCVVGSPYIKGGSTEGVPRLRLLISRLGNRVISQAMGGKIITSTGVLRAYRADCIKSIELFSSGKELHLEIISKLLGAGYKIIEMPAILRSRKHGKSKFNFRAIATSHLLFSLHEKPVFLFGLVGFALILAGVIGGAYIIALWQTGSLNPERPLMTLLVLLILTGVQILMFGFLGSGLVRLRKEIFVVQRENKSLELKIEQWKESLAAANQSQAHTAATVGGHQQSAKSQRENQNIAAGHQPSAGVAD
jgi:glycosyltransferase involved in cell wall biosynthesis